MQKTPALISILSILLLLAGIGIMGFSILGLAGGTISLSALSTAIGLALAIVAYGLSNMKKWGIYLYTIGSLGVSGFFTHPDSSSITDMITVNVVPLAILIFLWSNYRKFR